MGNVENMGCKGSKDKDAKNAEGGGEEKKPEEAPKAADKKEEKKPAEKAAAGGDKKPDKPAPKKEDEAEKRAARLDEFMSPELKDLMEDYFNRYDLDGSQSINTSEELKQLCTNLVVKLDLEMDVADIDKVVKAAGTFTGDENAKPGDGSKEWKSADFQKWFLNSDNFGSQHAIKYWMHGDESDEDDEVNPKSAPFLTGTYIGVVEGDGKKYTMERRKGEGKLVNGKYASYKTESVEEFVMRLRCDGKTEGDKKFLLPRKGCDSVGCFATSGYVEGKKFHYEMEYDIDGDKATVEPKLVLDGTLEDDNKTIKGEWKQVNEEANELMTWLKMDGVQHGTFKLE